MQVLHELRADDKFFFYFSLKMNKGQLHLHCFSYICKCSNSICIN